MLARAPASQAQCLNHHGPRYICSISALRDLDLEECELVDRKWLERDLYALLLIALAVCRRQQSESIGVALEM